MATGYARGDCRSGSRLIGFFEPGARASLAPANHDPITATESPRRIFVFAAPAFPRRIFVPLPKEFG